MPPNRVRWCHSYFHLVWQSASYRTRGTLGTACRPPPLLLLLLLNRFSRVRRQPTRLPRPWDSPGKNTGVGCHFPLQGMKVESESEVAQSHLTPSDPMDCSPPGSSIHGTVQARVLEWGAIACSKRSLTMLNNYKLILVLLDCFFCFCIFSLLWLNLFFN